MFKLGENEDILIRSEFFARFLYFFLPNLIQIGYEMHMQILVRLRYVAVEICSNWGKMRVH